MKQRILGRDSWTDSWTEVKLSISSGGGGGGLSNANKLGVLGMLPQWNNENGMEMVSYENGIV